jgi:hypothetical protein
MLNQQLQSTSDQTTTHYDYEAMHYNDHQYPNTQSPPPSHTL